MNKIICIILVLALAATISACSARSENSNTTTTNNEQTIISTTADKTTESQKVEKTVDAVAAYLGYSDGEEQFYDMIGAKDGKAYNSGELEIYLFDENSDEYKAAIAGNGLVKAATYKDGIILVFPNNADQGIVDKFNEIEF